MNMKNKNPIIKAFSMVLCLLAGIVAAAQIAQANQSPDTARKLAILPMQFIAEGNPVRLEEMRYRLQNIAYLYLKDKVQAFAIQDPNETNALLLKNGIKESNFRAYSPKEIAEILHVGYVLTGMVTQESTGSVSMRNTSRRDYERKGKQRETQERIKTNEELNTHIDLGLYNNKGEVLYGKSRRSILSSVDAYKNGIEFLLKRSPLYQK